MKKLHSSLFKTTALACSLASISPAAMSDTILGIYAGAGVWDTSLDGSVGASSDPITSSELGIDSSKNTFAYLAFEHLVPVIPNARVSLTNISLDGDSTVSREFTFDDQTFDANGRAVTNIDLDMTDVTLYYEILDNWVSIDVGVNVRMLDGMADVEVTDDSGNSQTDSMDFSGALPMLYGKARFDLPFSGLYVDAIIDYLSLDGNTVTDTDIKLGYMFEGPLDIGFELGYRQFKIDLDDLDDATINMTFDGPYANLALHF